jgi:putative inorganic carbon (HCO3(-)) transporter
MNFESKIVDTLNLILSKVHRLSQSLTEKSTILMNIEHIMFLFICISAVCSIFLNNNTTAPFLCIVGILYILTLLLKKESKFQLEKSTFFLLLYIVMAIVSTINSMLPHQSIAGLSKTILYLIYFYAVQQYLRIHKDKVGLFVILIGACVSFEIIVAFIQNYFDVLSAATWQDTTRLNPELVLTRVYGTLQPSNPNLLGGYFIVGVPYIWLYTGINLANKNYKRFILGLIFTLLSIPAIFMTGCRGAYIALFLMIITFLYGIYRILEKHNTKIYEVINKNIHSIIGIISIICVSIMVLVPKISHRIISIFEMRNDSSTSFRMNVYHSAIQMFHDNFLLGIGCGNKVFREIYGLYMLSGFDALSAYSIYIETAVESGIFALIFYILFIFFLIKSAIKSFFNYNDLKSQLIVITCLTSIIGVLSHGFVDTVYYRPQIQLIFWITVAMLTVFSEAKKEDIQS